MCFTNISKNKVHESRINVSHKANLIWMLHCVFVWFMKQYLSFIINKSLKNYLG